MISQRERDRRYNLRKAKHERKRAKKRKIMKKLLKEKNGN
jgi:hypothetical protein